MRQRKRAGADTPLPALRCCLGSCAVFATPAALLACPHLFPCCWSIPRHALLNPTGCDHQGERLVSDAGPPAPHGGSASTQRCSNEGSSRSATLHCDTQSQRTMPRRQGAAADAGTAPRARPVNARRAASVPFRANLVVDHSSQRAVPRVGVACRPALFHALSSCRHPSLPSYPICLRHSRPAVVQLAATLIRRIHGEVRALSKCSRGAAKGHLE